MPANNITKFQKVLIANRGEIAVRVMRTAKALGYRTVAVYSEADEAAPHVTLADQAVCIGPAQVNESYLCIDKIIDACKKTGADAVHPGYGFLSENSAFAEACNAENIVFIGPPTSAIELMGSKRLSKIAMLEADVPCIPGYEGEDQSDENLEVQARDIGMPVMLKASAGGGGRGMRLVTDEKDLSEQIKTARSEATNAFGNGELIIEKAVIEPRHIEIQIFCDQQGNAVYLGERDCSIQRRHQKVVEEAPSPFVDESLRKRMGQAAVEAAKSCHYVGAGTVEFLVDAKKNFYFLEMNTRLQVEHPVTELVTGTDLVEWQFRVASGEPLPLTQDQIALNGHAMEVRLYAEDPAKNFVPQTGPILSWQPAENLPGIRIDSGIETGSVVSPFYDPMLAKIIAFGSSREEARRKLAIAVEESTLFGITSNAEFLVNILRHDVFVEGQATTAFIEKDFAADPSLNPAKKNPLMTALAAILFHQTNQLGRQLSALEGWRNSNPAPWPYEIQSNQDEELKQALTLVQEGELYRITLNETVVEIKVKEIAAQSLTFIHENVRQQCEFYAEDAQVFIRFGAQYQSFQDLTHAEVISEDAAGSGKVTASMDGAIVDILVSPGEDVTKGQTLVVLEAMKMEHPLKADADGKVTDITVTKGDQVKIRQLLVTVETNN